MNSLSCFGKANKPQLAQAVTEFSRNLTKISWIPSHPLSLMALTVVSLVHRLAWKKGDSYILHTSYEDFTISHYGEPTVAFDGYSEGPSIKDDTHQRRGENTDTIVIFNADTEFVGRKDDYLSRSCNKQGLVNLMTEELEKKGCTVINASRDADVDIVKVAVKASEHQPTTLIGDDRRTHS